MAILYALVARATVVLAEFSAASGNIGAVARRILEKLPSEFDSRLCFSQDRYIFHILRSDGITFLCMANETFGRRVPFSYLEDIHMRFMKNYGKVAQYALAYAMNDEFSRVLHQQMEYFSSNPSADTLNRVRGEVSEAFVYLNQKKKKRKKRRKRVCSKYKWSKDATCCILGYDEHICIGHSPNHQLFFPLPVSFCSILYVYILFIFSFFCCSNQLKIAPQIRTIMVENIEKILERGDRIELLVDKTATMQDGAFHFKKQSKRLRRALWMKNAKLLALLTGLIVLLIYIIIAACCGGITLPSCRS